MSKLISVVWYKVFPAEFGGQKGVAEFTQYLSRLIPVHIICSQNNNWYNEMFTGEKLLPTDKLQFIKRKTYKIIEDTIVSQKPTSLLLEHPYYGWHGVRLTKKFKLNLIVRSHNIEFDRFKKPGKWWWPFLYFLERYTHRHAQLSLFKTNEDRDLAIRHFQLDPDKTMLAPIGMKRKHPPLTKEKVNARNTLVTKHNIHPEHKILLFNGTLDYAPNAIALKHIVEEILPILAEQRKDFTLLVTGRNEKPLFNWINKLQHPNMIQVGYVNNVSPYFLGADIFLNPVTNGGGMKVKLVEALEHDLTVISYRTAANGIDPSLCGKKLTIVPDNEVHAFVQAIQEKWKTHEPIPPIFFDSYHWEKIVKEVVERIDML